MTTLTPTKRSKVRRLAGRGNYDLDTICSIIDEALICHVGFQSKDGPRVMPTAICRIGDKVYIHGNRNSEMLRTLSEGAPACITVTHMDGLVLARSGFHHSMNYRSVLIHGEAQGVDGELKTKVLDAFVEHLVPGRTPDIRPSTQKELNATSVVEMSLDEAAAKIRTGPPKDDDEDYALDCWAGVIPLGVRVDEPIEDPELKDGVEMPGYVRGYGAGG
ncbi:MAG: pyridoxamine 5'-phosphate oxidase family protein [Pseudomonadota bacterium]